jgi:polysaccharide export outer membrane protein
MFRPVFHCFLGVVLFLVLSANGAAAASEENGYRIGAGDVLALSVWKDETLTRQVVVLPDGTISFPLIGQVDAQGKGLKELKQTISERLAKFVPDPILSLEVVQVNSLVIYVLGKVNRPGRFELADNINVLQALALAGGLNAYAKSGQVKVFRKSEKGTRIIGFDYDAVSKGKHLEQNISLVRGDVIVVR